MVEYKNKIKKYIVILLFVSILAIMTSIADADIGSNNTNDTVKFSIKSKFLGQDKNWNTDIIRINITVDRLGKLIYKENYYLEGGKSLKFQSSAKYFDAIMADKNISFNIARPKAGRISDRKYVFVESIIIFDNNIILNRTINLSNRYKLDYTNIPVRAKVVTKNLTTINKTTNGSIKINTTKSNNTNTEKNTTYTKTKKDIEVSKTIPPEKTNGFEVIIAIMAISILYIFRLRKEK